MNKEYVIVKGKYDWADEFDKLEYFTFGTGDNIYSLDQWILE